MTFSIGRVLVGVAADTAVAVQGVLDAVGRLEKLTRPPRRGADSEDGEPVGEATCGAKQANSWSACTLPVRHDGEHSSRGIVSWAAELFPQHSSASVNSTPGADTDPAPSPTIVQSAPPPTVDGGAGGGGALHSPGARLPHPDDAAAEWIGWAVPVIVQILAEHHPRDRDGFIRCSEVFGCKAGPFEGRGEWRDHAAPLIANALAPQEKTFSADDWHHREWELGYCSGLDHAIAYMLNGGPLDEIIREIRGRQAVVRPTK